MQVLVVVRGFTKEDVLTNQIKGVWGAGDGWHIQVAIRPFIPYPGGPNIPGGGGGMKLPLPLPLIFLCWSMFAAQQTPIKWIIFLIFFFKS